MRPQTMSDRFLLRSLLLSAVLFVAVFVVGMFDGGPNILLAILAALAAVGLVLLLGARKARARKSRFFLMVAGAAVILFAAGTIYGIAAMRTDTPINDDLYVGGVLTAAALYLVGSVGAMRSLGQGP